MLLAADGHVPFVIVELQVYCKAKPVFVDMLADVFEHLRPLMLNILEQLNDVGRIEDDKVLRLLQENGEPLAARRKAVHGLAYASQLDLLMRLKA